VILHLVPQTLSSTVLFSEEIYDWLLSMNHFATIVASIGVADYPLWMGVLQARMSVPHNKVVSALRWDSPNPLARYLVVEGHSLIRLNFSHCSWKRV